MSGYDGDDPELLLEPEPPRSHRPLVATAAIPDQAPPRESRYTTPSREAFEEARRKRARRSYWADALLSFLTPLSPSGAVAIVGLVTIFMLTGLAPGILGLAAAVIAFGVLFAYCFEVIVETAGGEDDLPMPAGIEEWWEIIPSAVGGMLVTFGFLALAPIVILIVLASTGATDETITLWTSIAGGLSVFMLPVALLAVAMGGVGTLARIDLLVRTILAALLQYLAIWVMLLVAFGVQLALFLVLASSGAPTGLVSLLLAEFVANAVFVYTLIVAMRQIGLFYRHFSDRFPWTAG